MSYPCLTIDNLKLESNCRNVFNHCHDAGLSVAAVTKCVRSHPEIVYATIRCGADFIADSRIDFLKKLNCSVPKLCTRTTMPGQEEDAVRYSDISVESEISVLDSLNHAAFSLGLKHRVVLMIDLGDLREGIFFEDVDAIRYFVKKVLSLPNLEMYGIGTNLSCFGSILPDETNLGHLVDIARLIRAEFSIELPFVSGGATSTYSLLCQGRLPEGITNLRIGEAWLTGYDTSSNLVIDNTFNDVFKIEAEIIEIKRKPSKPIGTPGKDAFGNSVEFADRGNILRAICAIGKADTDINSLFPCDKRIAVLGGSSDHLILDISNADNYQVGDTVSFNVNYSSLMHFSQYL